MEEPILNSYTTGLAPAVLTYMISTELKPWNGHVDSQEIGLPVTIKIEVPRNLSPQARQKLKEFEEICQGSSRTA